MPRLRATYREFVAELEDAGFEIHRHDGSSHRRYRRERNGEVRYCDVAYHSLNDEIRPKTLGSMIRQAGFTKICFENKPGSLAGFFLCGTQLFFALRLLGLWFHLEHLFQNIVARFCHA